MRLLSYVTVLSSTCILGTYSGLTDPNPNPSAPSFPGEAYPDIGQHGDFVPGTAVNTTSEVELSISAKDLIQADLLSKSDPFCVTYIYPSDGAQWLEYHRTETIWNNHDPEFAEKVLMRYTFEETQPLRFEFYDRDTDSSNLEEQDFLGYAECKLSDIITSRTGNLRKNLKMTVNGHEKELQSKIIVKVEELHANREHVFMKFSADNLDKKTWLGWGHSWPFIEIYKATEMNDYVLVYRSEVITRSSNPSWRQFVIPMKTLCNGDRKRSLKIVCQHSGWGGSSHVIGEFQTSLEEIDLRKREFDLQLVGPNRGPTRSYKKSGKLYVDHFHIEEFYSFMDYVKGGLQMNCTIAIDFTASNGNPQSRDSLHYVGASSIPNPRPMNDYEQAITSVVSIIEDYDSDKLFPVLGFGAILPPPNHRWVSHAFNVVLNSDNAYCAGVDGVLQAYRRCIRQVQLSGPTNFEPVIRRVINEAREYETSGENYFILLIITDGQIMDMPETISAIVEASNLPISIIIVGVGYADFRSMDILDADRVPLRTPDGTVMRRDIVQFVPFNEKFSRGLAPHISRARLAREVLAEIPGQVTSYMRSRNLRPKSPIAELHNLPPDPEMLY